MFSCSVISVQLIINNEQNRQTEAAGEVGAGACGGCGVDIDEAIQDFVSEQLRKNLRKQFSRKMKTLGELEGKLQKPSEGKMELRPLSFKNQEAEDSGSQAADEETPSVQTPKERKRPLSSTKQVLKVTQF